MELSNRPLLDTRTDAARYVPFGIEDRLVVHVERSLNALVLGGRGSGKSSLLHHLEGRLRSGHDVVHVDGRLGDDAAGVLRLVRRELGDLEALDARQRAATNGAAREPIGGRRRRIDDPDEPVLDVLDSIGDLVAVRARPVVVLLDEVGPATGHQLFGRLRDQLWRLGLRWVVAGDVARRTTYLEPPADAFFDLVVELAPPDDTWRRTALARRGLPPWLVDAVVRDTGSASGPRALLEAARTAVAVSEVFEDAPTGARGRAKARRHGSAAVDDALAGTARARQVFDSRVAQLGRPAELVAAELAARGPTSASDPGLQQALGWSRARIVQVLTEMERAGLVRSTVTPARGRPGRPPTLYELSRPAPAPVRASVTGRAS